MAQFLSDGKNSWTMWEAFLTVNSNLPAGFIAVGKDTEEGRQTVFFTPSGPVGEKTEEEHDDLSRQRKEHYKNKWFLRTQSIGSICKSTSERITILADTVSRHYPL